jgi:GDP-4-dehydro-6-deoxy-D-mannose reductase
MKQILVTGINGFVGHHVARELKRQGHFVIGTGTTKEIAPELQDYADGYVGSCDLTESSDVARIPLEKIDAIINLAGLAQVGASFGQEDRYFHINSAVQTVIADRLIALDKKDTRIIAVSTGAVYDSNQPMPLTEESTLVTQGSPYALSKVAMETAMAEYREKGLDIVIVRPFNHIGPGQREGFIVPDFVHQVLSGSTVSVGNLKSERDYTDVRDVARAYALLATAPQLTHKLYNVCSGKSISGQAILDAIIAQSGKQDVVVVPDPQRIRPNDPAKIVGDNALLASETGWSPQITLTQTIKDYFDTSINL